MVRGEIPWTGQGRPGNGGRNFERGSKLVHKSLFSGVLRRSDQSQSLTKRCAFAWRSRICLCTPVLRTGRSLHPRFSVVFGVFGIWDYPHEGQLSTSCRPLAEGWAFPGAPEFVRQGSYQFEFDCYTGR